MLTRRYCSSLGGLQQLRLLFSRHIYEPRLIVRQPEGSDKKPLPSDPSKPVILLFGWAGAEHQHLEKYSDIYTEKGYRTVSFISPCYHYKIPNARYGFYLSPVFRGIAAKPGNFESFKDSAPARTSAGPDSYAVVSSTPPIEGMHWVSTETRRKWIATTFNIKKAFANSVGAIYPPIRPYFSMYHFLLERVELPRSQLFLYSREDKYVNYKHIRKFVEHQRGLGNDVDEVVFGNSEHVQHFRSHPEQYRCACCEFVQKVEKSCHVGSKAL